MIKTVLSSTSDITMSVESREEKLMSKLEKDDSIFLSSQKNK